MSLSYYYGIFLRAPKQICYGLKCYLQKSTVKSFHTSSYHLKIDYPSHALQPLYISTQAVTNPTGHGKRRTYNFSSFQVGNKYYFNEFSESFSWFSSTIFHINCSKYVQETMNWSGLNQNLTKQICVDEKNAW